MPQGAAFDLCPRVRADRLESAFVRHGERNDIMRMHITPADPIEPAASTAVNRRRAQTLLWLTAATIAVATAAAPGLAPADEATTPAPAGTAVVHRRFEDGTLAGWNTRRLVHADSAVVQDQIKGRRAVRIELRPGDYVSGGWRDELTDPYYARVGQDLWYGFSTLIPTDYPTDEDNSCMLAQWHDWTHPVPPMLANRYNRGTFYVTHDNAGIEQVVLYRDAAFARGIWHDFVYHTHWSEGPDGYIEGWIDGRKVVEFHGPTLYLGSELGPYFKFGVYCTTNVKVPHVAYQADFSRGNSFADVDPRR